MLPGDFFASLDADQDMEIATAIEEMAKRQPALLSRGNSSGLDQKQGVQLFTALDTGGDGRIAHPAREAIVSAVAAQPHLLDFFTDAAKRAMATLEANKRTASKDAAKMDAKLKGAAAIS